MQRIVKVLTDNGRINKKLLKQTIESVLNRKNISLLDGKKWMEFSLKVDQILFREGVLVEKKIIKKASTILSKSLQITKVFLFGYIILHLNAAHA